MKNAIISVIIPAFNEEATIEKVVNDHLNVLKRLPQLEDYEVLCLDDKSTDKTAEILSQLSSRNSKVRVLYHQTNMGIYQSFVDLSREAKGNFIYETAADDQWPAENVETLFQASIRNDLDLVIGVRENRAKIYSLWRRALSFGFNLIPKVFFGIETKDANGVKLGRKEIFHLKLMSKSFFGEIERIIEAKRLGYSIGREAIHFLPRGGGKATGAKFKNVTATFRDFLRYLFFRSSYSKENEVYRKQGN